jgi:hypothetical protein
MHRDKIVSFVGYSVWVLLLILYLTGALLNLAPQVAPVLASGMLLTSMITTLPRRDAETLASGLSIPTWIYLASVTFFGREVILPMWKPESVLSYLGAIATVVVIVVLPNLALIKLRRILQRTASNNSTPHSRGD